ncbi:MAG: condensation domain-containing protein, partial [Myxococcota bacterium]
SLSFETGPVIRVLLVVVEPQVDYRLLIVVHHLVADRFSLGLLQDELHQLYQHERTGAAYTLAPATSVVSWAEHLEGLTRGDALAAEHAHWLAEAALASDALSADFPKGSNAVAHDRSAVAQLDHEATTELMRRLAVEHEASASDALLMALARALGGSGCGAVRVDVEYGREAYDEHDTSTMLGWLSGIYPVTVDCCRDATTQMALHTVRDQLRRLPAHGRHFGLLARRGPEQLRAQLQRMAPAQVAFSFLGRLDTASETASLWSMAPEPLSGLEAPERERSHELEVYASIADGALTVQIRYSSERYRSERMEALAADMVASMQALRTDEAEADAEVDVSLVELSDDELAQLGALIDSTD